MRRLAADEIILVGIGVTISLYDQAIYLGDRFCSLAAKMSELRGNSLKQTLSEKTNRSKYIFFDFFKVIKYIKVFLAQYIKLDGRRHRSFADPIQVDFVPNLNQIPKLNHIFIVPKLN